MRAFVAIRLSEESVTHLLEAQRKIERASPGVFSWTKLDTIHLTLYFLGQVDEAQADAIRQGLSGIQVPPFELGWGGLAILPSPDVPKVLAAGVIGETQALIGFQRKVHDQVFTQAEHKETRAFFPHATFGRLKRGIPPSAKVVKRALQDFRLGEGQVEQVASFELIQSELGTGKAIHKTLATFPLGRP